MRTASVSRDQQELGCSSDHLLDAWHSKEARNFQGEDLGSAPYDLDKRYSEVQGQPSGTFSTYWSQYRDIVRPDDLLQATMALRWPENTTRANVRPEGFTSIKAFALGMVVDYALGPCVSRFHKTIDNLTFLVTASLKATFPDSNFTTIQFNRDYASKMHVDSGNLGPSYIISLGQHQGGQLWIESPPQRGTEVAYRKIPNGIRGRPGDIPGNMLPGKLLECREKWVEFDGNTPHATEPFQGTRISIVAFTAKKWLHAKANVMDQLRFLGFPLPPRPPQERCEPVSNQLTIGESFSKNRQQAQNTARQDGGCNGSRGADEIGKPSPNGSVQPGVPGTPATATCPETNATTDHVSEETEQSASSDAPSTCNFTPSPVLYHPSVYHNQFHIEKTATWEAALPGTDGEPVDVKLTPGEMLKRMLVPLGATRMQFLSLFTPWKHCLSPVSELQLPTWLRAQVDTFLTPQQIINGDYLLASIQIYSDGTAHLSNKTAEGDTVECEPCWSFVVIYQWLDPEMQSHFSLAGFMSGRVTDNQSSADWLGAEPFTYAQQSLVAEASALIAAGHWLLQAGGLPAKIYIDNSAVLGVARGTNSLSTQPQLARILRSLFLLLPRAELSHVHGHDLNPCNELADIAAKAAALGTHPCSNIPPSSLLELAKEDIGAISWLWAQGVSLPGMPIVVYDQEWKAYFDVTVHAVQPDGLEELQFFPPNQKYLRN